MRSFNDISFKVKTIIGIAVIETILLALIYFTSINSLNQTNEQQIKARASETSNLIALWVKNGLLIYDVGNTESFINTLVEGESLVYIHVKNDEGKTFAFAGRNEFKDREIIEDKSLEDANSDGVFDVISSVEVDGIKIGSVEIGLAVNELSRFIDDVAYKIKAIAIAEVFLSALFSWMLGWLLTKRLANLKQNAIKIKQGNEKDIVVDHSNDEIGTVSKAFAEMAFSLLEKEKTLRANTLKLERVFDSTPEGIVVLMNDGKVGSVNPAFHSIVNCYRDLEKANIDYQVFIDVMASYIDKSDYPSKQWLESIDEFEKLETVHETKTIQLCKPNYRLLEVKVQLVNDEISGIHSILYFTDLTKNQELERLKSAFLAHAAHELRTPMTSVQGFSELLLMPNVSNEKRLELASIINTQSKRVVEMVSQLLDISAIESGGIQALNMQPVDLQVLVEDVLAEFKIPDDRETPAVSVEHDMPSVLVDYDKMYQVILNLLSNAYKYSMKGDDVSVQILTRNLGDQDAKVVDLIVADTGIGMNEEQINNVFERFWRADQSGHIPGTGLGMSLVKEIIEMFKGEILIDSELGKGSTFTIRLHALESKKGIEEK